MTLPLIPMLVLVVGVLMYALSSNSKVAEIGRISFAFGLLVVLLAIAGWHALSLR